MKTRLLALASIPLSLAAIAGATSLLGTQGATPFADDSSPSTSGVWHHYQAQETYIDMKGESIKETKEYYVECGSGVHQFVAPVSPKQLIEETKHPDISGFAVDDDRYGDIECTAGIIYEKYYKASAKTVCSGEQVVAAYNHGVRVTHIGEFAEKTLTRLLLPSTVTTIEPNAFSECPNLVSFTVPSTVTYVGTSVFYKCTSLETLNYYSSCDIQGDLCNGCSALTTVHIRGEVRNIGANAFAGTALTDIYYSGSEASWESIKKDSTWCGDGDLTPTIHFNYVA
ncbi:MAG: leucine-rich repeat domain-containing protein [Bacilli bacterium]|nr:leucine-rich repeat domain-containing protein [Bacilli bacterium]